MQNSNETAIACASISLPIYHFIARLAAGLVGASGNILVMVSLIYDPLKCFRNSSSYLILNLCVSDTMVGIEQIIVLFLRTTCIKGKNLYVLLHLPLYVSFSSITTMAFDRYMSSVYPLKYKIIITRRFILRLLSVQWLYYMCSVTVEFFYEKWLVFPRLLTAFVLLLGAVVMYGKAAYTLRKKSKELRRMSSYSSSTKQFHGKRAENEKRFLTTLLMISCMTVICLCPLTAYEMFTGRRYFENERLPPEERDTNHMWLYSLFFINFWINPFLYSWRLTRYRKTFSVVLKKLVCLSINNG